MGHVWGHADAGAGLVRNRTVPGTTEHHDFDNFVILDGVLPEETW